MSEYKNMKQGSEGSKWCGTNIRKYPITGKLDEYTPKETDKKIEVNMDAFRMPTDSESVRRQNNRVRDHRHRWAVETGPISVDTNSKAEQVGEKYSNTQD